MESQGNFNNESKFENFIDILGKLKDSFRSRIYWQKLFDEIEKIEKIENSLEAPVVREQDEDVFFDLNLPDFVENEIIKTLTETIDSSVFDPNLVDMYLNKINLKSPSINKYDRKKIKIYSRLLMKLITTPAVQLIRFRKKLNVYCFFDGKLIKV
jgi:hypothetical protein